AQQIARDALAPAVGVEEADHPLRLLKRLNEAVQEQPVETAIPKLDARRVMLDKGVHDMRPPRAELTHCHVRRLLRRRPVLRDIKGADAAPLPSLTSASRVGTLPRHAGRARGLRRARGGGGRRAARRRAHAGGGRPAPAARRLRRVVVVTSRAHSRRARLILRQALGPGIALAMHPSRYDAFAAARWWRVRRDAKIVLSEYEKLANYWLTESWRIAPCGG